MAGDEEGGPLVVNIIHRVRDERGVDAVLRTAIQPVARPLDLLLAPAEDE